MSDIGKFFKEYQNPALFVGIMSFVILSFTACRNYTNLSICSLRSDDDDDEKPQTIPIKRGLYTIPEDEAAGLSKDKKSKKHRKNKNKKQTKKK
jgi:hypothetical protein